MVASLFVTAGFLAGLSLNIFVFLPAIVCIAGSAFVLGLSTGISHAAATGLEAAIGMQIGYCLALLARTKAVRIFSFRPAREASAEPLAQPSVSRPHATEGPRTFAG